MSDKKKAMALLAAAEGTYYRYNNATVDKRYSLSFAEKNNSGISFGAMQLDVGSNDNARLAYKEILDLAVANGTISAASAKSLYAKGLKKKVKSSSYSASEKATINSLLSLPASISIIRKYDAAEAAGVISKTDQIIGIAKQYWTQKGYNSNVFVDGSAENLRLFAYISATINKSGNANLQPMMKWILGQGQITAYGNGGQPWILSAPPSINDMDNFFGNMTVWHGSYFNELKNRLNWTMSEILSGNVPLVSNDNFLLPLDGWQLAASTYALTDSEGNVANANYFSTGEDGSLIWKSVAIGDNFNNTVSITNAIYDENGNVVAISVSQNDRSVVLTALDPT